MAMPYLGSLAVPVLLWKLPSHHLSPPETQPQQRWEALIVGVRAHTQRMLPDLKSFSFFVFKILFII